MTPFEEALVNVAGIFGVLLWLAIWAIKVGLSVILITIVWTLLENIIDYFKKRR